MFCSVKKDKKNNNYRFYLCDRYRDKKTGKVKSSDKYIMTLPKENIISLSIDEIKFGVENVLINKGISLENINMILDKVIDIKKVVIEEYNTTIMFDVQQMYRENVKNAIRFNLMSKAFGIKEKDRFEIEEEELKKIQKQGKDIEKKIDDIYEEYLYINEQNEELKSLGSDIRLVQEIYIYCYDKIPKSEVWLVGGGYIRSVYGKRDFILPGYGEKVFEEWQEIKSCDKLDDNKAYFNHDDYFEEIELYRESNIDIDITDITGSLIRLIFSGNYELELSFADYIDIKTDDDTVSLNIEHLVDWINNNPTRYYKVTIDNLMEYKKQIHKFNKVY